MKNVWNVTKYALLYTGKFLKSVWHASYNILVLIVYVFLFMALLTYYNNTFSSVNIEIFSFIQIAIFLSEHWRIFWLAFFGIKLYDELRWIE